MELYAHITDMLGRLIEWSRRPLRFEPSWWVPFGTGVALGAMVVFIILFLEPAGTDRYQATWRTARLSGYGLCVLVPFLLVHALDRWRFRGHRRWRIATELQSKALVIGGIAVSTYLYNAYVVNGQPLSWSGFGDWVLYICLPYLPLLTVPAVLARRGLLRWLDRVRWRAGSVLIRGRNRGEHLHIAEGGFLFAEAQQNYVNVHYMKADGRSGEQLIRATLSELERQIPGVVRVHRSYLVNAARVVALEGNARKRRLRLAGSERSLPVSGGLDPALLTTARGGAGGQGAPGSDAVSGAAR